MCPNSDLAYIEFDFFETRGEDCDGRYTYDGFAIFLCIHNTVEIHNYRWYIQ